MHLFLDWPWCPRWFHAYDDTTIDGKRPLDALSDFRRLRDKGILRDVLPPPWTEVLVEGMAFLDDIDAVTGAIKAKHKTQEAEQRAEEIRQKTAQRR